MLHDAATQDDHACSFGPDGNGVDPSDILDDIDPQLSWRRLEGVEVEHVAETAVGEGGTEDGDVVLVGPVADRGRVVDLFAETMDDLAGCPVPRLAGRLARFLLLEELVEDGNQPVFEGAVVAVGHVEIADAIDASVSQRGA